MITVKKFEHDGRESRDSEIIGTNVEIADDLDALFKSLSRNKITELVLVERMYHFISSKTDEILNKKENK